MHSFAVKTALATFCLSIGIHAAAAGKLGPKVTLTCDFPAAQATQKVKPGKSNVSDGVIRISPEKLTFKICQGCRWKDSKAKWKVTPKQYYLNANRGIEITISREDGSATLLATSQEDEYYFSGSAESKGQCKIAEKESAAKEKKTKK